MLQDIIGQYNGVILIILNKWYTNTHNLPDTPHLGCSDISQHSSSVDSATCREIIHQVAWLMIHHKMRGCNCSECSGQEEKVK